MANDKIIIKGAREHNLNSIDVTIPRDKLVVLTGVSGSGKSSLAFDTIFADGQRRYMESLSSYARQFLGQMGKPLNSVNVWLFHKGLNVVQVRSSFADWVDDTVLVDFFMRYLHNRDG